MEIELNIKKSDKNIPDFPAKTEKVHIITSALSKDLKSESKSEYLEACKLLNIILSNITKFPEDDKYRIIKEKNPKFVKSYGKFSSGIFILELLGFEKVYGEETLYVFANNDLELLAEYFIFRVLSQLSKTIEIFNNLNSGPKVAVQKKPDTMSQKFLRDTASKKEGDLSDQLFQYRLEKKENAVKGDKPYKIFKESKSSNEIQVTKSVQSYYDLNMLKIRLFELVICIQTNEFRSFSNKNRLVWDENMSQISRQHSEDIGTGKVLFGHQGFGKRFNKIRFNRARSGGENIAQNFGLADPAMVAFESWRNSELHRKNMLEDYTYTGTGVYFSHNGYYIFTQLFVLV